VRENYRRDPRLPADVHRHTAKHDGAMADKNLKRTMGLTMATSRVIDKDLSAALLAL
jgi:hypothetical protein